jgi:hypothetical protein
MSASGTISNLQQALNCAGKCDCCAKLQQQINNLQSQINNLDSKYLLKNQKPQIIQQSVAAAEALIIPAVFSLVASQIAPIKAAIAAVEAKLVTVSAKAAAAAAQAGTALGKATSALAKYAALAASLAALAASIAALKVLGARIDALESMVDSLASGLSRVLGLLPPIRAKAESAQGTANKAMNRADEGVGLANSANRRAVTADEKAVSAQRTADAALSKAQSASNAATTASAKADRAIDTATGARSIATTASAKADRAIDTATGARSIATTANSTATTASAKADRAIDTATGARSIAERAIAKATQAIDIAYQALNRPIPRAINGRDGVNGKDGITTVVYVGAARGEKGERGERGLPGIRGMDGRAGKDGKDGEMNAADRALLTSILTQVKATPRLTTQATMAAVSPKLLTVPQVTAAAATGVCQTAQPNGCLGKQFNNLNNSFKNNLKNLADSLPSLLDGAVQAAQMVLLTRIDRKLGAEIVGGISGAMKNVVNNQLVQGATNIITTAATLHNALMLSNNLGATLFSLIDNSLQVVGISLKNEEGQNISVGQYAGSLAKSLVSGVIGAENFKTLSNEFKKANRIYQSAANLLNAVQSIGQSILSALEVIGGWNAKIGNALRKWGEVGERAYEWFNPQPNFQNKFFTGLETAQNVISQIDSIASETLSIKETINQLGEEKQNLLNNLKEDENSKKGVQAPEAQATKQAADDSKLASEGKEMTETDLEADED